MAAIFVPVSLVRGVIFMPHVGESCLHVGQNFVTFSLNMIICPTQRPRPELSLLRGGDAKSLLYEYAGI